MKNRIFSEENGIYFEGCDDDEKRVLQKRFFIKKKLN